MPMVLMTGGTFGHRAGGEQRLLPNGMACDLILAGRDPERTEKGAQQVRKETGRRVEVLALDLNSLQSVREGAKPLKAILERDDSKLECILCNAGAQANGPVTYSADSYETTFAGNCLGHFLLVNLLLDSIEADGRIVWTASGTHDPALLDGKSVGKAIAPDANAVARHGSGRKAGFRRAALRHFETLHRSVRL